MQKGKTTGFKQVLILLVLMAFAAKAEAVHHRFWLQGKVQFPTAPGPVGGSDCWGWTAPNGTEYALMGVKDGIAVVNAHTRQVITVVPGPTSGGAFYWRDIETYRHYAYAVAEETGVNEGVLVIDLQYLPDSVHVVGHFSTNGSGAVTAHTVAIDTLKGHLYAEGDNFQQPIRIMSLANPENPVFVGKLGETGMDVHDMFARNDTVFVAEGGLGRWSVWNAANKANPVLIQRISFPNAGYMHSTWPSENRQLLVTTEEVPAGLTMKVWNISNLSNIQMLGQYLGVSQIPHNPYVKGNLVFVSHYEAGVTVVDISNPNVPVEVARYDTYPASDNAQYRGCWSTYPYTANGFVYTSDIEGWLTVLRFGVNQAPVIPSLDTIQVAEGETLVVNLFVPDPDSEDVADLRVVGRPSWAFFTDINGTGTLTLTPGFNHAGTVSFSLIATDGFDADTAIVTIVVTNTNQAPVAASISPQSMNGGDTLSVGFFATDPEGDPIAFSASGLKPYIALVDSGNGAGSLTFTPGPFLNATDTVRVIASGGGGSDTALAIVTISGQAAVKGDLNGDSQITPSDFVLELNCVFTDGSNCPLAVADLDCDLSLTPSDLVLLLNLVFLGLPPPC